MAKPRVYSNMPIVGFGRCVVGRTCHANFSIGLAHDVDVINPQKFELGGSVDFYPLVTRPDCLVGDCICFGSGIQDIQEFRRGIRS